MKFYSGHRLTWIGRVVLGFGLFVNKNSFEGYPCCFDGPYECRHTFT
jgi:hypothetical protein